ncbi:MAG: cystathionine beta-synthase, partial [Candidatus Sericytochromatia bacterium]
EGLFMGISGGSAVVGAVRYARKHQLGPEAVMVILMPDNGRGYISKAFNDAWLRKNGLLPNQEENPQQEGSVPAG